MTTPYIDPQIVFASDAPTQDKPPAFNNYVKGMDETRSNDGRPTIKQFNFLQQQNDLKFLYIHERGACLPFVEGFPYENNAIVFKDGLIQQKNGASWVIPFMRGSQNLAELTDVAQARTKLDVYSRSEALAKDNNLSELTDKAAARTNLDVYSKAETDAIAGTPDATETTAGKAKIATTEIAQAGTNDTDIITAKKLRDALNATGGAPVIAFRAWATIDGTTGVIKKGVGFASVSKVATGQFVCTPSISPPDVNYAVFLTNMKSTVYNASNTGVAVANEAGSKTTTSFKINATLTGTASIYVDNAEIFIGVIY